MTAGAELMEEKLIKKLMTSLKCDSCGHHFDMYNVDVLGHDEGLWFFKVICSACHTQCLVAAVVKEDRVLEAVTDLTEAELVKFGNNVIGVDDLVDTHRFLKGFDGDFSRLFGQK